MSHVWERDVPTGTCSIYVLRLPSSAALIDNSSSILSEAERRRAAACRRPTDRARFQVGALLIRSVTARLLGVSPASVLVERTCDRCDREHGRPRVPDSGLHLSLSHSGALVAAAVTADGPVGVDVEQLTGRGQLDPAALADRVCAAIERAHVRTASQFLTCWTRKEAVLKATGEGLRVPPDSVVLSPPDEAPRLLAMRHRRPEPCQMADLDLGPGYHSAVAVLARDRVRFRVVEADLAVTALTNDASRMPSAPAP